jgi:hypothetical protein
MKPAIAKAAPQNAQLCVAATTEKTAIPFYKKERKGTEK